MFCPLIKEECKKEKCMSYNRSYCVNSLVTGNFTIETENCQITTRIYNDHDGPPNHLYLTINKED